MIEHHRYIVNVIMFLVKCGWMSFTHEWLSCESAACRLSWSAKPADTKADCDYLFGCYTAGWQLPTSWSGTVSCGRQSLKEASSSAITRTSSRTWRDSSRDRSLPRQ